MTRAPDIRIPQPIAEFIAAGGDVDLDIRRVALEFDVLRIVCFLFVPQGHNRVAVAFDADGAEYVVEGKRSLVGVVLAGAGFPVLQRYPGPDLNPHGLTLHEAASGAGCALYVHDREELRQLDQIHRAARTTVKDRYRQRLIDEGMTGDQADIWLENVMDEGARAEVEKTLSAWREYCYQVHPEPEPTMAERLKRWLK